MKFDKSVIATALAIFSLTMSNESVAHAEQKDEVKVKTQKLTDGIYVLFGRGGNIGLSVGEDGAYIIDDQFAELNEKINAAIDTITDQPISFVINTHWHFDHTGGNEAMGKSGATIVAHENVYKRMSTPQELKRFKRTFEPAPKVAQPKVTYQQEMSLKLNNDRMRIIHINNAHTDGDSIVFFEEDNVLHMGDCYFNIGYPFIDLESGGSINGYIRALETGLSLSNDETQIIPGHGPMATKKEMAAYVAMLKDIRNNIAESKAAGNSLEAVLKEKPSAKYDEKNGKVFIKPDEIVTAIYQSL